MLWEGCGEIMWQLGNIKNNTLIFFLKNYVLKSNLSLWKQVAWFLIWSTKKSQKTREITISKAGTTWQVRGISNHYTSREIYGRNILSTWCLSGAHDAHSPVLATRTGKFTVRWQHIPAAPFRLLHMRNRW